MTGAAAFAYHRALAPMLWVLVGLSLCELCLVHLLVALLWSGRAALALSLVTIAGLIWLVATIRSFRRLPVLVEADRVLMRAGAIKRVWIDRANIAAIEGEISGGEAKARDVLKLSLIAHPNIVLRLRAAVRIGRGRMVTAVAHRLDDPAAFRAALA